LGFTRYQGFDPSPYDNIEIVIGYDIMGMPLGKLACDEQSQVIKVNHSQESTKETKGINIWEKKGV